MNRLAFCSIILSFLLTLACRQAAAPISVSNTPVSINNIPQGDAPSLPAKPIEEMYWMSFAGQTQKLKDLEGKAVILDFWATNCPPCIKEIPHLQELQKKYGKENLEIIGLHVGDEEDLKKVPEFMQKLKIEYPIAKPEDALISFIFGGNSSIPQTAVFDRKGKMITKITGFDEEVKKQLDASVEQAVVSK